MILFNGEILDYTTEIGSKVKAAIKEIEKQSKTYSFKNPYADGKRKSLVDAQGRSTGKMSKPKPTCVLLHNDIRTEDGYNTWSFCKGAPQKDNKTDKLKPVNPRVWIQYSLDLNPKEDAEYIYFLTNLSVSLRKGDLYLYDEQKEETKQFQELTSDSEVKGLIVGRTSPVSVNMKGTEAYLRTIAAAWGVKDSFTDKRLMKVQLELFEEVKRSELKKSETKRGFDEFINDVITLGKSDLSGGTNVELMAWIQMAIDEKVILLKYGDPISYIFEPTGKELIRIKPSELELRLTKLMSYFKQHPEDFRDVQDAIGIEKTSNLTVDKVDMENNFMILKKMLKDVGGDYEKGDNNETLRQKIKDKMSLMATI